MSDDYADAFSRAQHLPTAKRGKEIGPNEQTELEGGEQARPFSQHQFPRFSNEVMAEAMMCFLGDEMKPCFLVNVTRF